MGRLPNFCHHFIDRLPLKKSTSSFAVPSGASFGVRQAYAAVGVETKAPSLVPALEDTSLALARTQSSFEATAQGMRQRVQSLGPLPGSAGTSAKEILLEAPEDAEVQEIFLQEGIQFMDSIKQSRLLDPPTPPLEDTFLRNCYRDLRDQFKAVAFAQEVVETTLFTVGQGILFLEDIGAETSGALEDFLETSLQEVSVR